MTAGRKLTMAQAISEAIGQEMERDPDVGNAAVSVSRMSPTPARLMVLLLVHTLAAVSWPNAAELRPSNRSASSPEPAPSTVRSLASTSAAV